MSLMNPVSDIYLVNPVNHEGNVTRLLKNVAAYSDGTSIRVKKDTYILVIPLSNVASYRVNKVTVPVKAPETPIGGREAVEATLAPAKPRKAPRKASRAPKKARKAKKA
jgi:hypothetical protein